ncbi:unnamed protein product [Effrenium voratum]|nr:unnamed protein product [Effrenium voratum]
MGCAPCTGQQPLLPDVFSRSLPSGMASDLSAPQFKDIDVAVAVTQASINATMKEFLSKASSLEVLKCFVYKKGTTDIVEIPYAELKANAHGSDPFTLKDGADQTNKDVFNLATLGFVGAFKAKGGLPSVPPANLPSIVGLGLHSDSRLDFNLTMSEFQIVGLILSGFNRATAINKTQPTGAGAKPWYYNFKVDLTQVTEDPNKKVPADVRARIQHLISTVGPGAFSVQKLLLDLETASLVANPVIEGVSDSASFGPTWKMISEIFTGAYFAELRKTGSPIFNYTITAKKALPQSTLTLKSLVHSTAPYINEGKPTASTAACLVYNLTRQPTPPGIVPFTWNWVNQGEVGQMSGVLAVRRAVFADYLTGLMASPSRGLCWDTTARTTHSGMDFSIYASCSPAQNPAAFEAVHATSGPHGGLITHKLSYSHTSSDTSVNSSDTVSIAMDFDFRLSGSIELAGTQIIITVNPVVDMGFRHHELGVHYTDLEKQNYYDKIHTVTYDLGVSAQGQLTATATTKTKDNSASWAWSSKGIVGLTGAEQDVQNGLLSATGDLDSNLDGAFDVFASTMTHTLNDAQQWVFPGADTFVTSHVFFSTDCDLVTQLRYASPNMMSLVKSAAVAAAPIAGPSRPPVRVNTNYKIETSAELMTNYVQSDILQPQKKFQALQTQAGLSLLFSIGTSDEFNVVVEEVGKSKHGWALCSLSQSLVQQEFSAGKVETFAVSQMAGDAVDRKIHVAMSVEANGNSHLYLSLNNSDADLAWTQNIPWMAVPWNAVDSTGQKIAKPDPLRIANITLTQGAEEYVVVDILRNQTAAQPLLERYWIDTSQPQNPKWVKHSMAADFEASSYHSALGRAAGDWVDGIYTMGKVRSQAQLTYVPVYNGWNPTLPPPVSRLYLPDHYLPDAFAACHRVDQNWTDLYVASQGGLYYFAATNQGDGAVATKLVSEPTLLSGVRKLFAAEASGQVTVWGLDGNSQIFYLTCKSSDVMKPEAWSVPLPIVTGVDAVSPYVDRKLLANTFFAHDGTGLVKCVKTPSTGLWTRRHIELPPSSYTQDSRAFKSFTTEIKVTNKDTGVPAGRVAIQLTSTTATSVNINHLYYVVGPEPVTVQTDSDGTVTIVELTHNLVATRFAVQVAGADLAAEGVLVNPMQSAFKRNSALDTKEKLKDAKVTKTDGSQEPFIPDGVDDDTLDQIAKMNKNLDAAHKSVEKKALPLLRAEPILLGHSHASLQHRFGDLGEVRSVDIGDLYSWLSSGIKAAIDIVKDAVSGLYHFVAEIGGKLFAAVLDCAEKIAAAVVWVYNQVKMAIEWIILFLEFLFGWKDILLTHNVIKKFIMLTAANFVNDIGGAKKEVKKVFGDFKANIAEWTGAKVPGATETPAEALKAQVSQKTSAPGNLGTHHFKGNARRASAQQSGSGVPSALQLITDLCEKEEQAISNAATAVKTEVIDQFSSLDLGQIIERLVGIIGITLVDGTEDIALELLSACEALLPQLMGMLDKSIHIPVLSWLYKFLTGNELSFLDLLCLIAAIPATLFGRIANGGHALFSSGDAWVQRMLDAKTMEDWSNAPWATPPNLASLGASDDDDLKKKKLQALALGFGGGACFVINFFLGKVIGDLKDDEFVDEDAIKLLTTLKWICSMAVYAPYLNQEYFEQIGQAKKWYSSMGKIVGVIGKCSGFLRIFYCVKPKGMSAAGYKKVGIMFATVSTVSGVLSLIPDTVSFVMKEDLSAHSFMKTLSFISGDGASILSLPIQLTDDPDLEMAQLGLTLTSAALGVAWPFAWLAE